MKAAWISCVGRIAELPGHVGMELEAAVVGRDPLVVEEPPLASRRGHESKLTVGGGEKREGRVVDRSFRDGG